MVCCHVCFVCVQLSLLELRCLEIHLTIKLIKNYNFCLWDIFVLQLMIHADEHEQMGLVYGANNE